MFVLSSREVLSRSLPSGLFRLLMALAALFAPITWMVKAFLRQHRVQRAHEELMALDDRTLKDLGIDRSDIGRVVRFGRDAFGMEVGTRDPLPYSRPRQ